MKNILKKLSALAIGGVIALGVSVGFNAGNNDLSVHAESNTTTIDVNTFSLTGSYPKSAITAVKDGITFEGLDIMKSTSNIQMKKSTSYILNTTSYPGNITQITVTQGIGTTARACTVTAGKTKDDLESLTTPATSLSMTWDISSAEEYRYFKFANTSSNALYATSIEITYEPAAETREVSSVSATIKDGRSFFVGDSINPSDFDVAVTYSSGEPLTETITDGTGVSLSSYKLDSTSNSITVSYGGANSTPVVVLATEVAITDIKFEGSIPLNQKLNGQWNLGDLKVLVKYNNKAEYDDVTNDKKLELLFDPEEPNSTSITSVTILAEYPGAPDMIMDDFDVSVQEIAYEGLIEDGTYYIKHTRVNEETCIGTTYYLKSNGTSAAPAAITDKSLATPLVFEKVGDNEYSIKTTDGSYLYTTDSNNGLRIGTTEHTWMITIGTRSGGAAGTFDIKSKTLKRFISLYNVSDFRTYTSADATNRKEDTQVEKVLSTKEKVSEFVNTYMHMAENVEGQCHEYYGPAKTALLVLGNDAIALFQSDDDFNAAQERYEAWARANKDVSPYEVSAVSSTNNILDSIDNTSLLITIIIILSSSTLLVGLFITLKRRKER